MKAVIPASILALIMAVGALAQTPPATVASPAPAPTVAPESDSGPTWTVTVPVVSQYMFRGVRLGGLSAQPSLDFSSGSLNAGVWTNFPLKDKVPGVSDPEIDVYGSYKVALSETVSLQPGFTWYNYPEADDSAGFYKSTFEPSLALNFTVAGVSLTPKVYYDVTMDGPTYELNAFYAVPLKDIGSELDFTASIGTFLWKKYAENTSPAVKNWGDYWLVGVSMPFQVTSTSKLTVGFAYTKGSNNFVKQGTDPKVENSAAVGRGVVTISYALSF